MLRKCSLPVVACLIAVLPATASAAPRVDYDKTDRMTRAQALQRATLYLAAGTTADRACARSGVRRAARGAGGGATRRAARAASLRWALTTRATRRPGLARQYAWPITEWETATSSGRDTAPGSTTCTIARQVGGVAFWLRYLTTSQRARGARTRLRYQRLEVGTIRGKRVCEERVFVGRRTGRLARRQTWRWPARAGRSCAGVTAEEFAAGSLASSGLGATYEGVLRYFTSSGDTGIDYRTRLTFTGSPDSPAGTGDYFDLPCAGELTFVRRDGPVYVFAERLTSGQANCEDNGTVTVTVEGDSLLYEWNRRDLAGDRGRLLLKTS